MDDLLDLTFDAAPASASSNRQASTTPAPSSFTSRTASPFLQGSSSANPARANYNLSAASSSLGLGMSSGAPSRTTTPLQRPSSAASKEDAFQSLFAMSATGGSSSVPHSALSLGERQRKMDQERQDKERRERDAFNFEGWGHAAASSGGATQTLLHPVPLSQAASLAGSRPVSRPLSAVAHPIPLVSAKTTTSWDFDGLLAPQNDAAATGRSSSPLPAPKQPQDPWDMAIFDSALPAADRTNGNKRIATPADEDVLGLLSKPVERESGVKVQKVSRVARSWLWLTCDRPISAPSHRGVASGITAAAYHWSDRGNGVRAESGETGACADEYWS